MRPLASVFLILLACSNTSEPPPVPAGLQLVRAGLSNPVFVTSPPGDTLRLFVVEQGGRVRVLRRDSLLATAFLDVRGKITADGERGLLSLAFHPQYAANGRFYVYFTDSNGDIRIVRYLVSADANVADSLSADTVLAVAHPGHSNHNGGQLAFGPDGKLYAGLGDGGGGGDPDGNGQDKHALLGKLHPLGVVVAAVLFGGLIVGTDAMTRVVSVPGSIVFVLQGVIVSLQGGRLVSYQHTQG